jgi:hypothetical protein
VNVTMLGGGFGRRANPDFALEAVQIAKAAGHRRAGPAADRARGGECHA